jgi:bidirectional [NiFe] hydrogenase diaphorase subunit
MVSLTIDDREVLAEEGKTILEVARSNGIYIPTLCYHEGVSPYGACRLCMVEIVSRGRERLVASCLYPVEDGLTVRTNSERIMNNRRTIMELLLARCSGLKEIQDLAKRLGVETTPFKLENKKCILCGLCVRACEEVVGVSAISLVNRGSNRQVASPFYDAPEACIGCGSCAYICPVKAIKMEDIGDTRTITMPNPKMQKIEFRLKKCSKCGKYWAPERQLEYIAEKAGLAVGEFDVCPDCRD